MEVKIALNQLDCLCHDIHIVPAFTKVVKGTGKKKDEKVLVNGHWSKEVKEAFNKMNASKYFLGEANQHSVFSLEDGSMICAWGFGEKSKLTRELLRRKMAKLFKFIKDGHAEASIEIDPIVLKKDLPRTLELLAESIYMTDYAFDKYLTKKQKNKLTSITFQSKEKKAKQKACERALEVAGFVGGAVKVGRDLVNEPPNHLYSTSYAKIVEKDVKGLKGVKYKVLGRPELKKEKMGLFLSVNSGSAHDPRLVHLTYTPKKVTKNTKHIALVGKGLTFDSGGYSIKPGGSMMNMKFDMAGSATVYAAFKAAAQLEPNVKITCLLGMTDNAINEHATMPDSICIARNGMSVEILNTDAEGRLVLADCLDYACSQKPNVIIDAATLTGACLVALGTEVCGLMGNSDKLTGDLKKAAHAVDEQIWELPIIDEWREDMKSPIADLKNIGGSSFAGTAKAAAFLENFICDGIEWAHLDIAGIGDSAKHLPYCPPKGGSGLMIRTLVHYLTNYK